MVKPAWKLAQSQSIRPRDLSRFFAIGLSRVFALGQLLKVARWEGIQWNRILLDPQAVFCPRQISFIARDCSLPDIQIPRSTADFCLDVSIGCFHEPSLTVSQDGQSLRAFCPSGGDPTFESLIPLLMFLLPSTSIEESNVPWLRTAGLRDTKLKMTLRDFLASSWLRTDPGGNECPNARVNPKGGLETRLHA